MLPSKGKGRERAKWGEEGRLWLECSSNEAKARGNVGARSGSGGADDFVIHTKREGGSGWRKG